MQNSGSENGGEERGQSSARWLVPLGSIVLFWIWKRWRRRAPDQEYPGVAPIELERGHVPEDSESAGGIAAFAAGLLVLIVGVLGVAALLISILEKASPNPLTAPDAPFTGYEQGPSQPQLQSDPAIDLLRVRRREHALLSGYRWVDRERGTVSIPIDRAMEIMAARPDTASRADAVDAPQKGSLRLITESGFVELSLGVPEPGSPAFLGMSPESYTVSPDFARDLGLINVTPEKHPLE